MAATATLDVHGGVQGWSGGAREILGYTPREVLGRPASDLTAEEGDVLHDIKGCRTDRPWSGPVRLRHRDGHTSAVRRPAEESPERERRPLLPACSVVDHQIDRRHAGSDGKPAAKAGRGLLQHGIVLPLGDGRMRRPGRTAHRTAGPPATVPRSPR
ncbi:PAS domain S-box protein [Streptomyces sp. NPDC057950]|uniref:PAS domain S-box protein n=1 Tax=Streptomyces sp. NPDC057950 TaxID=3346288 RepID=UPI0036EA98DB